MIPKEDLQLIRRYLLGGVTDEREVREVEERILLDDAFYAGLSFVEDELMEEYLDNTLSEVERTRFLEVFLASPERRKDLLLVRNLRKYAVKVATKKGAVQSTESTPRYFRLKDFFSFTPVRVTVAALLVAGLAFGIWRAAIHQSDTERGLAQLRIAYHGQRLFESRTTVFSNYAAYAETRGGRNDATDSKALDRAHRYLIDASVDPADGKAHHALGLYYLAERDFERARGELKLAASSEPTNSRLQTDAGAAYLEMAKDAVLKEDAGKAFELLNESLGYLDLAIALDPKLPEPRFDRALCLQTLMDFEQAKEAWREYLLIDPHSGWADEARLNLQKLEERTPRQRSAAELESDFLAAYRKRERENARGLLQANRELISGKYLPQRLAMSFLDAPAASSDELLSVLLFAGELELSLTGDPFANEIAKYYSLTSPSRKEALRLGQEQIRFGYAFCLDSDFASAVKAFQSAKAIFEQTGNIWESKIAQYLLGYALISTGGNDQGFVELTQVSRFASEKGYLWLDATALYWIGGSYVRSRQHSKAQQTFKRALSIGEKIDDPYILQRNSIELSNLLSYSGQPDVSLQHLYRAVSISTGAETSLRQRYRTLIDSFVTLSRVELLNAAVPQALEAVLLSNKIDNKVWKSQSRNFAGVAYAQINDFDSARRWANEAINEAKAIDDEKLRDEVVAFCNLKFGDVERVSGNYDEAERHYSAAIDFYDTSEMPLNREEAHKGLLLTYLALDKLENLESQIIQNIRLTEEYRSRIVEKDIRMSFFESRQNVYDIAADFEFRRGNLQRAYEYTEMASARSLLDQLRKGTLVNAGMARISEDPNHPGTLSLPAIRDRMPHNVQIVQYSVLDDKVLAWVVSHNGFHVSEIQIAPASLEEKISEFRQAILDREKIHGPRVTQFGRELYDLLIDPIRAHLDPKNEICIVPSKSLFKLPFAALISPGGTPLISDFNILYAPSVRVFLIASDSAKRKETLRHESVLSVGNPTFDRDKFDPLPNLTAAESEAREVSLEYESRRTLIGKDALKTAFLAELPHAEVIHIAGHYVVVPGLPSSSFLLMAASGNDENDSRLTNLELSGRHLPRAKLMVLAACDTGLERVYNGEGMIGISRTMLESDIPIVVGSQWSVESTATALLMKLFHGFRKREYMASTSALRKAQLKLLNNPSGPYSEPYYWAAFSVYGGNADF